MERKSPDEIAKEIEEELSRLMSVRADRSAIKGLRRFRFAIGLLCLAPFCAVVAFFPWPRATFLDKVTWIGYALVLLFVGAWQLDKSSKESDAGMNSSERPDSWEATSGKVVQFRRR